MYSCSGQLEISATFCRDHTLLSLFFFSLIFPLCHPLQFRILHFSAPRGSALFLPAAPTLPPPGLID